MLLGLLPTALTCTTRYSSNRDYSYNSFLGAYTIIEQRARLVALKSTFALPFCFYVATTGHLSLMIGNN